MPGVRGPPHGGGPLPIGTYGAMVNPGLFSLNSYSDADADGMNYEHLSTETNSNSTKFNATTLTQNLKIYCHETCCLRVLICASKMH